MVETRYQVLVNAPGTPENSEARLQNVDSPPQLGGAGEKTYSRTEYWRRPFRTLQFEEEEEAPAVTMSSLDTQKFGKDELFTGREGGLPLTDFDKFLANMSEIELRPEKCTDRFALFQMPRCLGG